MGKGANFPMKILMLTWEYPPRIVGGIARVVHDLSKRLIKDGHEVTVITYKDGQRCRSISCRKLHDTSK